MTEEELKITWTKFFRTRDNIERDKLIVHFFNTLAKKLALYRYKSQKRYTLNEIWSFSFEGVKQAVERATDLTTFVGYATRRISGSIIDGMREWSAIECPRSIMLAQRLFDQTTIIDSPEANRTRPVGILTTSIDNLTEDAIDSSELFEDRHDVSTRRLNLYTIKQMIDSLTTHDLKIGKRITSKTTKDYFFRIIKLYYYDGYTMEELAHLMNMSESRISQIHSTILKILKKKYNKEDLVEILQ